MKNITETHFNLEIFKTMKVHHRCSKCKKWFVTNTMYLVNTRCPSCSGEFIEDTINITSLELA